MVDINPSQPPLDKGRRYCGFPPVIFSCFLCVLSDLCGEKSSSCFHSFLGHLGSIFFGFVVKVKAVDIIP